MNQSKQSGCLLGWLVKLLDLEEAPSPRRDRGKAAVSPGGRVDPPATQEPSSSRPAIDADEALCIPAAMVSKKFMSPAAVQFFRALQQAAGADAYILAQVSLGQLVYFKSRVERFRWWNRIRAKSIDFVLCDPVSLQPILAIELDDRSHLREDRRQRDRLVDAILDKASLPILHVRVARGYDVQKLREAIAQATRAPHAGRVHAKPQAASRG